MRRTMTWLLLSLSFVPICFYASGCKLASAASQAAPIVEDVVTAYQALKLEYEAKKAEWEAQQQEWQETLAAKGAPTGSVEELVAWIKTNPGESFGSLGAILGMLLTLWVKGKRYKQTTQATVGAIDEVLTNGDPTAAALLKSALKTTIQNNPAIERVVVATKKKLAAQAVTK